VTSIFFVTLFGFFLLCYGIGHAKAKRVSGGHEKHLHSRPTYHGAYLAMITVLPALAVLIVWSILSPMVLDNLVLGQYRDHVAALTSPEVQAFIRDSRALAFGYPGGFPDEFKEAAAADYQSYYQVNYIILAIILCGVLFLGFSYAHRQITPQKRTRHVVERITMFMLIGCSVIAILTTIGIVLSLVFESLRFFQQVPITEFLFGIQWSPQTALRADQVGAEGAFGAIPLLAGTLLITAIAISVAAPIGLFSAIYLSDYASPKFRAWAKPMLEILAGVPTVVYGFFAALTVAPFFRNMGESVGLSVSSESALAAGVVMGIMIIPFVSSLSDDVINAVPQALRDGSSGLGATKSETIRNVVLPAALPGIVSAMILAISRAIGETMIVVMAAGLAANLTINPLEAVTTVTVQIVTLLVGDQEFDSAKTLSAFALGLMLFCVTLALNIFALRVVQRYREQYD
jgi:phosphate transport system permease protein